MSYVSLSLSILRKARCTKHGPFSYHTSYLYLISFSHSVSKTYRTSWAIDAFISISLLKCIGGLINSFCAKYKVKIIISQCVFQGCKVRPPQPPCPGAAPPDISTQMSQVMMINMDVVLLWLFVCGAVKENWHIDGLFVGPSEMTFCPTKSGNFHNLITHFILANHTSGSRGGAPGARPPNGRGPKIFCAQNANFSQVFLRSRLILSINLIEIWQKTR